jgi:LmbE family N-acetylglucosaminyl deacetylase
VATVLHLAPHPDDEVIAAPGTLLALRDAGHRVVSLACSLGRPEQQARRRAELTDACERAGLELLIHEPPLDLSAGDDLGRARRALAASVERLVRQLDAPLVIAPSPHDRHHGHEVVGRAAVDALSWDGAPRLWLWGLWASLPLPTLYVAFGEDVLERALDAVRAHAGELARNDYVALVRARAIAGRVQGSEQVFGYGAAAPPGQFAEVLTEVAFAGTEWWAGVPRELDAGAPLAPVPRDRPLGWWLRAPGFGDRVR